MTIGKINIGRNPHVGSEDKYPTLKDMNHQAQQAEQTHQTINRDS
jgi:hypothetical protein